MAKNSAATLTENDTTLRDEQNAVRKAKKDAQQAHAKAAAARRKNGGEARPVHEKNSEQKPVNTRTPKRPDTTARRADSRPSFKQRFYDRFGGCLAQKADSGKKPWSPTTRVKVIEYARSLVFGDGSIPDGLTGKLLDTVHWHFVMTCLHMKARPDSFPGQSMDWFPAKYAEALAYQANMRQRSLVNA